VSVGFTASLNMIMMRQNRAASKSPKLFTCPKCRHTYLGHDPLPDCPRCGYDYREKEGFRWDVLVYLLVIMGLISFFLVSSYYRDRMQPSPSTGLERGSHEKLPGSKAKGVPFESPYRETGQ
jgi:hypothetical protein